MPVIKVLREKIKWTDLMVRGNKIMKLIVTQVEDGIKQHYKKLGRFHALFHTLLFEYLNVWIS